MRLNEDLGPRVSKKMLDIICYSYFQLQKHVVAAGYLNDLNKLHLETK